MKNFTRILIAASLVLMVAFNAYSQDVFRTANVGIGTTTPQQKLDVAGSVRFTQALMPNGSAGTSGNILLSGGASPNPPIWLANGTAGQVLTISAGVPTWTTLSLTAGWALIGNSIAATNFLGTTDAQPLVFKVNNAQAGRIDLSFGVSGSEANTYLGAGSATYGSPGGATGDGGTLNVGIGISALGSAGTNSAGGNTAVGAFAYPAAPAGDWNTSIGSYSQYNASFINANQGYNVGIGAYTLYSNSTGASAAVIGSFNTAIGYQSMYGSGTPTIYGNYNTAIGTYSLYGIAGGGGNTALGTNSLYSTTGGRNVGVGDSALYSNTTGEFNTGIGYQSNVGAGGLTNATAIGYQATAPVSNSIVLGNTSVVYNAGTGAGIYLPGYTTVGSIFYTAANTGQVAALAPGTAGFILASTGTNSVPGWISVAGVNSVSGTLPIYVNTSSPYTPSAPNITIQGNNSGTDQGGVLYSAGPGNPAVFTPTGTSGQILESFGVNPPQWVSPGTTSAWSLIGNSNALATSFLGTTDAQPLVFKVNNTFAGRIDINATIANTYLGYGTGGPTGDGGIYEVGVGYLALGGQNLAGAGANVAVGAYSYPTAVVGDWNVSIGAYSQYGASFINGSAGYNVAIGAYSLYSNSSGASAAIIGSYNTAIGYQSMYGSSNTSAGNYNVALGYNSLYNISTGGSNTAIGTYSLYNTTAGKNTAAGDSALYSNTTGENNTALGYQANVSPGSLTNATAIGANALAGASNTVVLGSINTVNGATASASVGIGTTTPQRVLEIGGLANTIRVDGLASTGTSFYSQISASPGNIVYSNNSNGDLYSLPNGANGTVLTLNANSVPSWVSPNAALATNSITGNAGTSVVIGGGFANSVVGASNVTLDVQGTAGGVFTGTGSGTAAVFSGAGTAGQVLTSGGAGVPTWSSFNSALTTFSITGNTGTSVVISGGNLNSVVGSSNVSLDVQGTAGGIFTGTGSGTAAVFSAAGTSGYILQSTGAGAPTWVNPSTIANAWLLTGNTTAPTFGTNFIGFTNAVPVANSFIEFVTNGSYAGVIDQSRANVLFGRGAGGDSTAAAYAAKSGGELYAIGAGALESETSASAVVAIGYDALHNYTTGAGQGNGFSNNAVGALALYSLTTGIPNNALGTSAGYNITIGTYNVSVGFASNYNQTTGSFNVAAGDSALYGGGEAGGTSATYTANYNTAVGVSALSGIGTGTAGGTGGTGNTAVGYEAAEHTTTGIYNTAVGYKSVYGNSTGTYNVGVGYQAGYGNTTGNFNTGIGYRANFSEQTAYGNVAVGSNALFANTWSGNTAIGTGAMQNTNAGGPFPSVGSPASPYVGGGNVAVGDSAMYANVGGVQNTVVGFGALTKANGILASNDTAVGNTAIGFESMFANTNALYNTTMGDFTLNTSPNTSYCVVLGFQAMRMQSSVAGFTTTRLAGDIAIGDEALIECVGSYDIGIGGNSTYGSLGTTSGSYDISIGNPIAANGNTLTTGSNDIQIGSGANAGTTLNFNTAIGYSSIASGGNSSSLGYTASAAGSNATAIGEGTIASGTNNTALGAGANANGTSNATAIGAGATASTANTIILGEISPATSVGIGVLAPARLLEVGGTGNTIRIDGIGASGTFNAAPTAGTDQLMYAKTSGDIYSMPNGTNGYVLTIGAGGIPTWAASTATITASAPTLSITGTSNVLLSGTYGGVFYGTGVGVGSGYTGAGTPGEVLIGQGPALPPTWSSLTTGGDNWGTQVVYTDSDAFYPTQNTISGQGISGGVGNPLRLASQNALTGQVLAWNGTTWKPASGNASLTTNNIINGGGSSVVTIGGGFANSVVGGSNVSIDVQGATGEVLYGKGSGVSAAFTTGGSAGQVLELTGGVPTWTTLATGTGWFLTGNGGTTPGTNFLGTTDANGLEFKVNNQPAGMLDINSTNGGNANAYLGSFGTAAFGPATTYGNAGNTDGGAVNVAVGLSALGSATGNVGTPTSTGNVAVGAFALAAAIGGTQDVAIGFYSQRLAATTVNTQGFNTSVGAFSLFSNSTGSYNTTIGYQSMYGSGTATAVGAYNTALGYDALYAAGAGEASNTAIGSNALLNATASRNTAVGDSALYSNTTGTNNTALGYQANVTGNPTNATVIGFGATQSASNSVTLGNASVASLYLPGYSAAGDILYTSVAGGGLVAALTPGIAGTVLESGGTGAAPTWQNVSGVNNVIGTPPIYATASSTPTVSIQGNNSGTDAGGVLYSAGAGNPAAFTPSGTSGQVLESFGTNPPQWVNTPGAAGAWALTGNSGTTSANFLGPTTSGVPLNFKVNGVFAGDVDYITQSVTLGYGAYSEGGTSPCTGVLGWQGGGSTTLGYEAAYNCTAGTNGTFVGAYALFSATAPGTASIDVAVGYASQYYATQNGMIQNTSLGGYSLYSNAAGALAQGENETALGYKSMYGTGISTGYFGNNNTAIGYQSLYDPTGGAGEGNTAVGSNALYNTAASHNTGVGDSALASNTTGTYNTAVGYNATVSSGTLTYATAIGANAQASQSNSLILGAISGVNGASSNTNVGIGTQTPDADAGLAIKTLHLETQGSVLSETAGSGVTSVSLTGTDMAGVVNFSVASGASTAPITVNFANNYNAVPTVIITPANAATGAIMGSLQPYVTVSGSSPYSSFTINFTTAPSSAAGPLSFNYFVIESQ